MFLHSIPHLVRRGGVFCFRMAVPRDLRARFGLLEFKGSLKTGDSFTARGRCRRLSTLFEQLIAKARAMPDLSRGDLEALARSYFERCATESNENVYLLRKGETADFPSELEWLQAEVARLRLAVGQGRHDEVVQADAATLLAEHYPQQPKLGLDDRAFFLEALMRARLEDRRILLAKLEGRYDDAAPRDALFREANADIMPALMGEGLIAQAPPALTLEVAFQKYRDHKIGVNAWVGKTVLDNDRVIGLVKQIVGSERQARKIDVNDVKRVRDALQKLPSNYSKKSEWKGKGLEEIFALSAHQERISAKTQEKYWGNFRAFLKYLVDEELIDAMPGPNIKLAKVKKAAAIDARYPFTTENLQKFLRSPLYVGHKSESKRSTPGSLVIRDGKFWIPLVGMWSGMRLGEIVQLLLTDVKAFEGVPYFDVDRAEDEEKQIKTEASRRRIPVHPALIDLGFLQYVEAVRAKSHTRVFPDIQPGKDGYFSHNFSKWFSRYLAAVGVKTSKTSFHSFRHNFRDELRQRGVTDVLSRELMGHADNQVHNQYGSKPTVPELKEAIEKVRYASVALNHLLLQPGS